MSPKDKDLLAKTGAALERAPTLFGTTPDRYKESLAKLAELLPKDKKHVIHLWGIGKPDKKNDANETPFQLFDLLTQLKDHDYVIHVSDIDPELVASAERQYKRRLVLSRKRQTDRQSVFFHKLDISEPEASPPDKPDVIIATNVQMYLPGKKAHSALEKLVKSLKKDGIYMMDAKDVHVIRVHLGLEKTAPWPLEHDIELDRFGLEHVHTAKGKGHNDWGVMYRKKREVKL